MTVNVEELIKELIKNQSKILQELEEERRSINSIQERLSTIEKTLVKTPAVEIPPSLIRVLRALDSEKPLSAEDVAKKVNLSRNLTSGYLNKLAEIGYVLKEPNLEGKGPRYLFRANTRALPDNIRKNIQK